MTTQTDAQIGILYQEQTWPCCLGTQSIFKAHATGQGRLAGPEWDAIKSADEWKRLVADAVKICKDFGGACWYCGLFYVWDNARSKAKLDSDWLPAANVFLKTQGIRCEVIARDGNCTRSYFASDAVGSGGRFVTGLGVEGADYLALKFFKIGAAAPTPAVMGAP